MRQYCAGCHNDTRKTGGVSFDGVDLADVSEARRSAGEGCPKAARRSDAAARIAAARCR